MIPDLHAIAERIAQEHMATIEYCNVYEDEDVIDLNLNEIEMQTIHNLMISAEVVIT